MNFDLRKNQKKTLIFAISAAICFIFLAAINVFAVNNQIKTTESFIIGSDVQISTATNAAVNLYIGDNLAGITNPVKSVYFIISGIYTDTGAGGTLEFKINDNPSSSKIFTLPTAGTTPTPFEIIYKDDSNTINSTSAGSYAYTLNIIPTNITISSLSGKMEETQSLFPV
ncbi:hypothetical protein HZC33_01430 [Candidatus Wolfebacteria bacterium]|nr:hypothetical protein [Candidatus Wolfebacteria bacterium]